MRQPVSHTAGVAAELLRMSPEQLPPPPPRKQSLREVRGGKWGQSITAKITPVSYIGLVKVCKMLNHYDLKYCLCLTFFSLSSPGIPIKIVLYLSFIVPSFPRCCILDNLLNSDFLFTLFLFTKIIFYQIFS